MIRMEHVILVDEQDQALGLHDKVGAHLGDGLLHRAFTTMVFNPDGQLLLAQRAVGKMLWPLWWDSTCASHPRKGETYESAGGRRLTEELGFACPLRLADKFSYHVAFEDVGSERDVCATLIGVHEGDVRPDPEEVADWEWVDVSTVVRGLAESPERYTPWFIIAMERLLTERLGLKAGGNGRVDLLGVLMAEAFLKDASELVQPLVEEILAEGVSAGRRL
jgi:isopentenyl-diphosphate delta-isomerase